MDMIVLGQVERITARHGGFLQLRPKAANAKALTEAIGAQGEHSDAATRLLFEKEFHSHAAGPSFSVTGLTGTDWTFLPHCGHIITAFFWQGFFRCYLHG